LFLDTGGTDGNRQELIDKLLADYFDACRRKRNEIDYTGAAIATSTEADELVLHARSFLDLVERWIESNHPMFER
jgi:uncharacterized protein (UPF0332 family)